jgi:hypothetical protein
MSNKRFGSKTKLFCNMWQSLLGFSSIFPWLRRLCGGESWKIPQQNKKGQKATKIFLKQFVFLISSGIWLQFVNKTVFTRSCLAKPYLHLLYKHLPVSNKNETGSHFVFLRRWMVQGYPELNKYIVYNIQCNNYHLFTET